MFITLVVALVLFTTLVPYGVLNVPAERLPEPLLRWRNGGGLEIARGTVAGRPWFVHAAHRRNQRRTCAYILHDTPEERSDAIPSNDDPFTWRRQIEGVTCGLAPTADGSGFVGAMGGVGFTRYRVQGTGEWLLFGVVPANVRKVTVTARGRQVTADTISHPDYQERFFVIHQPGFGPGESSAEPATITGMLDAEERPIRVYWS